SSVGSGVSPTFTLATATSRWARGCSLASSIAALSEQPPAVVSQNPSPGEVSERSWSTLTVRFNVGGGGSYSQAPPINSESAAARVSFRLDILGSPDHMDSATARRILTGCQSSGEGCGYLDEGCVLVEGGEHL